MTSPRFAVSYVDGSHEVVARRPVHLMRAEAVVAADAGPNEVILATLWAASTGGTGTRDEFEAWAETVDDWERSEEEPAVPLAPEPADSPN